MVKVPNEYLEIATALEQATGSLSPSLLVRKLKVNPEMAVAIIQQLDPDFNPDDSVVNSCDILLSVTEASRLLGISTHTLRRLDNKGLLKAVRMPTVNSDRHRRRMFRLEDVQNFKYNL